MWVYGPVVASQYLALLHTDLMQILVSLLVLWGHGKIYAVTCEGMVSEPQCLPDGMTCWETLYEALRSINWKKTTNMFLSDLPGPFDSLNRDKVPWDLSPMEV